MGQGEAQELKDVNARVRDLVDNNDCFSVVYLVYAFGTRNLFTLMLIVARVTSESWCCC